MSISNIRILVKIETLTTCLTQAKQRCNMNQLEKVNGSKEAGVGGEWAHNSVQTIPAESLNPVLLQLCLCLAPCWKPCQADILLSLWLLKGREDTHQPQVSYSFLFFPERVGQVEKRDMWHDCPGEDSRKEQLSLTGHGKTNVFANAVKSGIRETQETGFHTCPVFISLVLFRSFDSYLRKRRCFFTQPSLGFTQAFSPLEVWKLEKE